MGSNGKWKTRSSSLAQTIRSWVDRSWDQRLQKKRINNTISSTSIAEKCGEPPQLATIDELKKIIYLTQLQRGFYFLFLLIIMASRANLSCYPYLINLIV